MDISADKSKPKANRPDLLSAVRHVVRDFFGGLIGLFVLTESDRRKAGIQIRRLGE